MFSFFKCNPTAKLSKQHAALLEKAMRAQRNGDIKTYSVLTAEADEIFKRIQNAEAAES